MANIKIEHLRYANKSLYLNLMNEIGVDWRFKNFILSSSVLNSFRSEFSDNFMLCVKMYERQFMISRLIFNLKF